MSFNNGCYFSVTSRHKWGMKAVIFIEIFTKCLSKMEGLIIVQYIIIKTSKDSDFVSVISELEYPHGLFFLL